MKYEFPCYPGDEVWYIEMYQGKPLHTGKDIVQMVGLRLEVFKLNLETTKTLIRLIHGIKMFLLVKMKL